MWHGAVHRLRTTGECALLSALPHAPAYGASCGGEISRIGNEVEQVDFLGLVFIISDDNLGLSVGKGFLCHDRFLC